MQQNKMPANKAVYKALNEDKDYTEVRFNEKTGGLSAIHKEHKFDRTIGVFGIPRGNYEKIVQDILFHYGRKIIFGSEMSGRGIKMADGWLDDEICDIKGIESMGKYTIRNQFLKANDQGVHSVILYYHKRSVFSEYLLQSGYESYLNTIKKNNQIQKVYYVVETTFYRFK
jgi:hypothetical protein